MRLELKDINDGCLVKNYDMQPGDFPILAEMEQQGDIHFRGPIAFTLRMQKAGQLIETEGHLTTRVKLSCGSCLQPFVQQIDTDFAFTFTPYQAEVENEQEEEVELETDELGLNYYKDECLDLLPPLQDQLVMSLPISPLCAENCAGLCSECGCDLNKERCHCTKKPFNSKFTALAGLKVESSPK